MSFDAVLPVAPVGPRKVLIWLHSIPFHHSHVVILVLVLFVIVLDIVILVLVLFVIVLDIVILVLVVLVNIDSGFSHIVSRRTCGWPTALFTLGPRLLVDRVAPVRCRRDAPLPRRGLG
jgi:hypothetical protein